ncbi:V-type ATP synthase subunit F [Dolosigranulum pigrum]|uniref:V-type ATP synthase subunit F n=1 Tax=Dolosigranulum pigrum TaxID=29394 RepID=UPI001AD87FEC|nr:V-type ATP synthase subunit F [Dolosigranulum pigrum]QTJ34335.1 V-type ATP synthase subunit F [Dolosigranulum pigrum]QTJ39512.1 V-type ATP synthase subunit F [Dolosigranulum pigrum]QTJ48002.1 V-type ATP synthase subunit F [Dolosigranulum pigrum]QTJ49744.1 V-type ATP synthase subunit F [Dolosigranulum pigrum]
MASKIGVVGDKDSILGFKMLGFDTRIVQTGSEARQVIDAMAEDNFGIIYLTEKFAEEIPETIERYDVKMTPAVILIPNYDGSRGIGKKRVQDNVEKAVGQNIL